MTVELGPDSPLRTLGTPKAKRQQVEAGVQSAVGALFASVGATVNVTSTHMHAKGVTPGIPDLLVQHVEWRWGWDWETKALGKRQSQAQRAYEERNIDTGRVYGLGGVHEAEEFLLWLGIAFRRGAFLIFKPRAEWRQSRAYLPEAHLARRWAESSAHAEARTKYEWHPPTRRRTFHV